MTDSGTLWKAGPRISCSRSTTQYWSTCCRIPRLRLTWSKPCLDIHICCTRNIMLKNKITHRYHFLHFLFNLYKQRFIFWSGNYIKSIPPFSENDIFPLSRYTLFSDSDRAFFALIFKFILLYFHFLSFIPPFFLFLSISFPFLFSYIYPLFLFPFHIFPRNVIG